MVAGHRPQTCVLHVTGDVDAEALTRLQERCDAELRLGTTTLVLDFTAMTGCPSALLGMLASTMQVFRRHARTVELVGLLEALTSITGLPIRT